jgi:hypothetical protein
VFERGSLGNLVDGRTSEGRYIRSLERALVEHLGGADAITVPQRLLVERAVRLQLQMHLIDAKMRDGTATPHDGRTYGGMLSALRLTLRELGLKAAAPKAPSLAEVLAEIAAASGDGRAP